MWPVCQLRTDRLNKRDCTLLYGYRRIKHYILWKIYSFVFRNYSKQLLYVLIAGLFVDTVIGSFSDFELGSSIKQLDRLKCVHITGFTLENAMSYNNLFLTLKVVKYGWVIWQISFIFFFRAWKAIHSQRMCSESGLSPLCTNPAQQRGYYDVLVTGPMARERNTIRRVRFNTIIAEGIDIFCLCRNAVYVVCVVGLLRGPRTTGEVIRGKMLNTLMMSSSAKFQNCSITQ